MKRMKVGFVFLIVQTLALSGTVWAKPLALVWNGPGVCPIGCAKAAARVARMAGFTTQWVNTKNMDKAPFDKAKLWVQPGGHSNVAAQAMGPALLEKIRSFVAAGGGYTGFCAGMFLSTSKIGTRTDDGLGITPGQTELYLKDDPPAKLVKVKIGDRVRKVYYAGGPMLHLTDTEVAAQNVTVLARYDNGDIASINARYGAGHVSVSGFHPEAGWLWSLAHLHIDTDGSDRWFAVQMIKLSTPGVH
ncbi:MAG: hypothetical protein JST80_00610 [Bdellovibrionales bacterium]|nr:hypothetical protein [Bdellovibrionales bacterium]